MCVFHCNTYLYISPGIMMMGLFLFLFSSSSNHELLLFWRQRSSRGGDVQVWLTLSTRGSLWCLRWWRSPIISSAWCRRGGRDPRPSQQSRWCVAVCHWPRLMQLSLAFVEGKWSEMKWVLTVSDCAVIDSWQLVLSLCCRFCSRVYKDVQGGGSFRFRSMWYAVQKSSNKLAFYQWFVQCRFIMWPVTVCLAGYLFLVLRFFTVYESEKRLTFVFTGLKNIL